MTKKPTTSLPDDGNAEIVRDLVKFARASVVGDSGAQGAAFTELRAMVLNAEDAYARVNLQGAYASILRTERARIAAAFVKTPEEAAAAARLAIRDASADGSRERGQRFVAAQDALQRESKSKGELAELAGAHGSLESLEEELSKDLAVLRGEIESATSESVGGIPIADGILSLDAVLAEHIGAIGPAGFKLAASIRVSAANRLARFRENGDAAQLWKLWLLQEPLAALPPAVETLAHALWRDRVGPEIDKNRRKPPALVRAVAMPLLGMLGRARREWEPNGQRTIVLPNEVPIAVEIGAMVSALQASRVADGMKLFSSVVAHRVLRWQITTAHKQALEGNPDPRVIRLERGQRELAHDILGFTKKDAPEDVLSFLCAEDATRIPVEGIGPQRLILLEYTPGKGRRPSCINHVVGTLILPDYVHELQRAMGPGRASTIATRLVPIPNEAPLIGSPRAHASQLTFQLLIVAHLVDHSRELAKQGGVVFSPADLAELAKRAGLTADLWPQVIDRWLHDGPDGAAFLKRGPSKGLLTLGDAHTVERDFIIEGGVHRNMSSDRAVARVSKKRALVTGRNASKR